MDREKLKIELGDGLCECCPWKNGEISHRCDAVCEGSYCDDAMMAMLLLPRKERTSEKTVVLYQIPGNMRGDDGIADVEFEEDPDDLHRD